MSNLQVLPLIFALSIDTLVMAVSLGAAGMSSRWRIAFTFAAAEAIMPVMGLLVGNWVGQYTGTFGVPLGAGALVVVGIWLVFVDEDDDASEAVDDSLASWTLFVMATGVSIDELAAGFSSGLLRLPIQLLVPMVALQAFIFTLVGLTLGERIKPYLGEWAESLAGLVLIIFGLWLLLPFAGVRI